jgi:hypothetical protein
MVHSRRLVDQHLFGFSMSHRTRPVPPNLWFAAARLAATSVIDSGSKPAARQREAAVLSTQRPLPVVEWTTGSDARQATFDSSAFFDSSGSEGVWGCAGVDW